MAEIPHELVQLTEAQIETLKLSDADIQSGNLISHEQLNENDLLWLDKIEVPEN